MFSNRPVFTRHLSGQIGGRDNWIDQLRLAAAVFVVLGHSWHIALGPQATVPFEHYTLLGFHELAVHVFFFLSGLLVTESARRHGTRPFTYAMRRIRRIFPALIVNAITVPLLLVLVGAWTGVSVKELCIYAIRLITLGAVQFTHSGAFADNPFPGAINGSVWSLRHEIVVYVLLCGAGVFGALQQGWRRSVFFVGVAALSATGFILAPHAEGGIMFILAEGRFVMFSFLLGVMAHQFAQRVPLHGVILLPGLIIAVLGFFVPTPLIMRQLAVIWVVCAATLLIAFPNRPASGLSHDISYGVYIYSWPFQQLTVFFAMKYFGVTLTPLALFAACMGPIALAAFASWIWVERPALRGSITSAVKLVQRLAPSRSFLL